MPSGPPDPHPVAAAPMARPPVPALDLLEQARGFLCSSALAVRGSELSLAKKLRANVLSIIDFFFPLMIITRPGTGAADPCRPQVRWGRKGGEEGESVSIWEWGRVLLVVSPPLMLGDGGCPPGVM